MAKTTRDTNAAGLTVAFERLAQRLRVRARQWLGNDDDAADALQEAFCRLWMRGAKVADSEEAAALLTTTVKNLSADELRRRKRASLVSIESADAESLIDGDAFNGDEEAEVERSLEAVERRLREALTEGQYRVWFRREVEGASFREIARETGLTETAIRMTLSRARTKIREIYKHYGK